MKLKEIRMKNGYTQFTISKEMGISRGTYSLWEIEIDYIPIRRLNDFCNINHVSIDYCLGFTNIPSYNNSKSEIDIKKSSMRLKEIRKRNNRTQDYIAKKLDLDRSLLSKYERGKTLISTTFLMEYIKLFGISGDYLLGKIEEEVTIKETVKN